MHTTKMTTKNTKTTNDDWGGTQIYILTPMGVITLVTVYMPLA